MISLYYIGVLPSFTLLAVGRTAPEIASAQWEHIDGDNGEKSTNNCSNIGKIGTSLWREYELSCPEMRCRFVERFRPNFLELCSTADNAITESES